MAKITLNELKQTFARRLRVARLMCGLSQAELVAKMKELAEDFPALYKSVSTTAVERYGNAVMFPENSSILVTLAEALNTNVDNLTRQFTIRIDKDFSFRKKSKLGKKRIDVVKMKVQQCIEKYVEIENITGDEPKFDAFFNNIVVKKAEDARLVANELRKKWNLGDGPISQPIVVLEEHGVDTAVATLLPATHEATAEMLNAVGFIDVCIPRGGRKLIDFVRNTAKVPVIETGAGVVNTYLDKDADIAMAARIVENGKTRRCSVCNALDCLIVHADRLQDLPAVCSPLARHEVMVYADPRAYQALAGSYPSELLQPATDDSFGTEFMAMKIAIRTVDTIDEALDHIQLYGSGHSEAIITSDETAAHLFLQSVDAACVYWNAPTSFTDGAQFGLGAEIGISTQKLGPRGPMALEEMTTYKWIIEGEGQVRDR